MTSNNDFALIAALDLDPIKMKLMHKESGEGWSMDHANAIETEYRRFLYLMKAFPHVETAPLVDVDTFWHYHILDTMKYARDCDQAFGYFLHHHPYLGLAGENGREQHEAGERMRELYESTFGVSYVRPSRTDGAPEAADVQTACGPLAGQAANSAWCTGIGNIKAGYVQTAWCTGIGNVKAAGVETAWCTDIGNIQAADVQMAWCTGIGNIKATDVQTAWCTGIGNIKAVDVQTAWCTGIGNIKAADVRTAWCTGIGNIKAADVQTAWCTGIGNIKAADGHEARGAGTSIQAA